MRLNHTSYSVDTCFVIEILTHLRLILAYKVNPPLFNNLQLQYYNYILVITMHYLISLLTCSYEWYISMADMHWLSI